MTCVSIHTVQLVGEKVGYALSSGLQVIACIGEQLEDREAGNTNSVVSAQLQAIAGRLRHMCMCNVYISSLFQRILMTLHEICNLLLLDSSYLGSSVTRAPDQKSGHVFIPQFTSCSRP